MQIIQFNLWRPQWQEKCEGSKGVVGIKPDQVSSVEHACDKRPELDEPTGASFIKMKNGKDSYLVQGTAEEVIAKLNGEEPESVKHERTANFYKRKKQLHFWVSPNMHGWRDCADEAEAAKLIEESGVKQNLNVE